MQPQLVPQRVERMVQRDHFGQPEARQPHEAGAAAPPRHVIDELDRCPVTPVQVLGHQQQRPALGVTVDQLPNLAQHSIRADTHQLSTQCLALVGCAQPRQLQQPSGRDRAQQCRNLTVSAAQLRKRLQHRQIGFAGTVQIDALTARASDVAKARDKVFNKRGLTDPGLAGNPDHCTFTAEHSVPEAAQLRGLFNTTDEPRLGLPSSGRTLHLSGCRYVDRDGDKPITSARHCFDKPRLARIIIEHRPQIADRRLENRVADVLVTPNLVEQGVLAEQHPGPSGQRAEKGEGRRRQCNGPSAAEQGGVCFIELELVEVNPHRIQGI